MKHLISNAIAFHDAEKLQRKIVIQSSLEQHSFLLEVSDNGIGIPQDHLSRIFDVFFRGTESSIGLGMGLFLVKSLTEKMDGIVSCKSTVKEGTAFFISFPKRLQAIPDSTQDYFATVKI